MAFILKLPSTSSARARAASKSNFLALKPGVFAFAILLVIGGLLAWAFSGVSIYEAGTVSWLYFVLTFGYLVFLSIVNLIKFLVKLAQKQDKSLRGEE